jgi:cation transporter-like permease
MQPLVAALILLTCLPLGVHACATCFGASDSDMARGMNMGIFTLLGVLAFVLSVLVAFFVFIGVRAARTEESPDELVIEEPLDDRD